MYETVYVLESEQALHCAFKFALYWGHREDYIYSAQHAHIGIQNALKALALRHGLSFEHEAPLMEMMSVFSDHGQFFLEDRGIDEVILLHSCRWSLLDPHGGSQPPDKALLLDAISVAEKIIAECKKP